MSDAPLKKRVDESWKEQVEREKQAPPTAPSRPAGPAPGQPAQTSPSSRGPAPAGPDLGQPAPEPPSFEEGALPEPEMPEVTGPEGLPEARFDLFVSGLAMEALIALGDMANPVTRRQSVNLAQAKYLIDVLGILEEKTAGNLSVDEQRLLQDTLYQLRMRYMRKSGGAIGA